MTMAPATRFGLLGGGLLVALGGLGFAVTGAARPLTSSGARLLGIGVNPAQNIVHVQIGMVLVLAATSSTSAARTATLLAAAALGVIGLFGLALVRTTGDPLGLNGWSNALHLGLSAWASMAALRSTPTTGAEMAHQHAPSDRMVSG